MRRLAAVFTSKRSDKSDAGSSAERSDRSQASNVSKAPPATAKSRSGFFRSLSKGSLSHPGRKHAMPPVSTMPDHVGSSASSSSGGPRTPSDDHESLGLTPHSHLRGSWLSQVSDVALPSPAPSKPMLRPYQPQQFNRESDQASETTSESNDADERGSLPPTPAALTSPSLPIPPVEYFRAITTDALHEPFSPPPLVQVNNGPFYPRSCNLSRQLSPSDSLYARVLRKRLLGRLDRSHESALPGFHNRRSVPHRPSLVMDDIAIPKTARVLPASQGLRIWTERPCFEDRVLVYLPAEHSGGELRCERVYASAAVEALGYSEHLEALAGLFDDIVAQTAGLLESPTLTSTPPFSSTPSTASLASVPPSPALALATAPPPASISKILPNGPSFCQKLSLFSLSVVHSPIQTCSVPTTYGQHRHRLRVFCNISSESLRPSTAAGTDQFPIVVDKPSLASCIPQACSSFC